MERLAQAEAAARLRELHEKRRPLVLPNAWDAGSARVIEAAGAAAIATTSAGIALAHGYSDGQELGADRMLAAIGSIVAAVHVPVTADVEGGYGDGSPAAVADVVGKLLDIGVAGINLEDSPGPDGSPLRSADQQAARLRAAREAADAGLVLNARTDGYLLGVDDPEARLTDTVDRVQAYLSAGADCVFVPGAVDPTTVGELVARIPGPLNVMAGPGAPDVADPAALGVARISVGPAVTVAAYDVADRAARELLQTGTYAGLDAGLDFGTVNGLFRG